eukprot:110332-Rhodomonas_salina.1
MEVGADLLAAGFAVQANNPHYVVSDFGPTLAKLQTNVTRAGVAFDPPPTCMVVDFYGNLVTAGTFRLGLFIRDSDRDEFDAAAAKAKFGKEYLKTPWEESVTRTDRQGCAPHGFPEGRTDCPPTDSGVDAVTGRDIATTPEWCPATQEKRFCRGCLNAERYFESFNSTMWKQTYEFADSSRYGGTPQFRGAFDCPTRLSCPPGKFCEDPNYCPQCSCLVDVFHANGEREFDICEACSTRALPGGIPVALTENGKAVFRNIMCFKPRRGYRFSCHAPQGDQGDGIINPVLVEAEWDLPSRRPTTTFGQDSNWGRYNPKVASTWVDGAGNEHPDRAMLSLIHI